MPDATPTHTQALPPGHAGLLAAIDKAGGGAALARAVGVTRFAVQQWKAAGVPASRAPAVARLTGIPLHDLRPDLFHPPAAPAPAKPEAA